MQTQTILHIQITSTVLAWEAQQQNPLTEHYTVIDKLLLTSPDSLKARAQDAAFKPNDGSGYPESGNCTDATVVDASSAPVEPADEPFARFEVLGEPPTGLYVCTGMARTLPRKAIICMPPRFSDAGHPDQETSELHISLLQPCYAPDGLF